MMFDKIMRPGRGLMMHMQKESHWRVMGALNARTGQVHYLDNYIVGRRQVIELFRRLDQAYSQAQAHLFGIG